jgi:fumarate hydratase class II
VTQLQRGLECMQSTLPRVAELALGGTAVGTGLNTPVGYAEHVAGRPIFFSFSSSIYCNAKVRQVRSLLSRVCLSLRLKTNLSL